MKRATSLLVVALMGATLATACLTAAQAQTSEEVTTSFLAFGYRDGAFRGKVGAERGLCLVGQSVTVLKKRTDRSPKVIGTAPLKLGSRVEGPGRFRLPAADPNGRYFARFREVTIAEYARSWVCLGSRSETIKV